ncbi:hypothetical protein B0T21DRAFT_441986 [Apiosordaria backusii]|uniref:Uncharacterized protein n=1 Tax=Apiosordaria backusii TaxID=314023 RepID=A0AA40BJR6_9PEZI|nr:hypothetical protein B0T21DRAFT_441986 [Apiosordaria backusii]
MHHEIKRAVSDAAEKSPIPGPRPGDYLGLHLSEHLRKGPRQIIDLAQFDRQWIAARTLLRGYSHSSPEEREETLPVVMEAINKVLREISDKFQSRMNYKYSFETHFAALDTVRKILRYMVYILDPEFTPTPCLFERTETCEASDVILAVLEHMQCGDLDRLVHEDGGAWIEDFWDLLEKAGTFCEVHKAWNSFYFGVFSLSPERLDDARAMLAERGVPSIDCFMMGR